MKQLLSLFLFLVPCLALAQYPSNGNQKITLGEQTTADGLIWRGVAADTTLTAKSDTAAYFVLDTANLNLYTYKVSASGKKWIQLGSDTTSLNLVSRFAAKLNISDTASMLTPYWRAGRFSGVLPVANGGTGSATKNFVDLTNTQTVGGAKTLTSALSGTSATFSGNVAVGTGTTSADYDRSLLVFGVNPSYIVQTNDNTGYAYYHIKTPSYDWSMGYDGANNNYNISNSANPAASIKLTISSIGNVGIGTASPAVQFHTTSNVRFAGLASITDLRTDADGDLFNGSDFNLKNSIDTINFGLKDVLKLKPVQFNWNDISRNLNEYKNLGFIAQDVMDVIPNAASSMGDGDMQVDYNAIVATLTKAIQEQQALIKTLEQRIINLENK
jgi:hypothetical protein